MSAKAVKDVWRDIYEVVVERHRSSVTVLTSNRDPSEWLAMMSDPDFAEADPIGSAAP